MLEDEEKERLSGLSETRKSILALMSALKLFGLSTVITMVVTIALYFFQQHREVSERPVLARITDGFFLASQLKPGDLRFLRRQRVGTIIDIRPDGEAADQSSSEEMKRAAGAMHMRFHYIPVPHDRIPDEAVASLLSILNESDHDAGCWR